MSKRLLHISLLVLCVRVHPDKGKLFLLSLTNCLPTLYRTEHDMYR